MTQTINTCSKCGNRPILEGVKKNGRIWHSVTCPGCGKSIPQVVGLSAAVSWWNEENSAKEARP